jgi:membrane associated rhomboid family serine protease
MFFLPLFDENSTSSRPIVVWMLMAACIVVFFWQQSLDDVPARLALYQLGFVPTIVFQGDTLPTKLTLVPAWVTIFTSMFLHGGWLHLGGNMLYLWIFGDNVEDAMGRIRFILFYLLCGVAAALAQAAINPSSSIPMVGASGGIAGVLGAYLVLHPKAAVRCLMVIIVFFRFINLPAWLVLGGWIGLQFAAAPQAFQGTGGGVAYMAHIGGFVAGVALIPFFKKSHVSLFDRGQPPKKWSGQPISFSEVKQEARKRFRRSAQQPARSSVPPSNQKRSKGPWG